MHGSIRETLCSGEKKRIGQGLPKRGKRTAELLIGRRPGRWKVSKKREKIGVVADARGILRT